MNQLNWEQRGREDEYVQWVRGLIRLRKQYRLFRLGSAEEIRQRSHVVAAPHPVFGYTLLGDDEDLAVYVNPSNATVKVELPAQGRWEKLAGNTGSALAQVGSVTNPETVIGGYELAVWKKDRC